MWRCCPPPVRIPLGGSGPRLYSARTRLGHSKPPQILPKPQNTPHGARQSPALTTRTRAEAATRASPLLALQLFLAPANLSSPAPQTHTPDALAALYAAARALPRRTGSGVPLNCYALNELLVLFGSLSIPAPCPKCIYIHPFAARMPTAPFRTYWPLVLELGEEIRVRKKRKPRTGAHHYWVMRAHLAAIQVAGDEPVRDDDDPRLAAASEATARYLRIRNTVDLEVHVPYLHAMVSLQYPKHVPKLVNHLCKVLELHANPHHRLVDLAWQLILGSREDPAAPVKERFLATLWTRLRTYPYVYKTRNPKPTRHVFDTVSKRHIRLGVTVPQLCAALATSLFPHFRLLLPPVVWLWAVGQSRAVFNPQQPLDARWSNLVLLSMYVAPRALSSGGGSGVSLGDSPDGASAVWRTVLALAMFERTVEHSASPSSSNPVRLAVRRLWRMWKHAHTDVPPLVRRVVVGAFFRLAAKTGDAPLKDSCQRYCVVHGLWGSRVGETKADLVQTTELFVDYVFAALYTEAKKSAALWSEIFAALPADSPIVQWRARVADALFRVFLAQDGEVAHELYLYCQRYAIPMSTDSAHAMSLLLAFHRPYDALGFLSDTRFSPDQVEELLDCVLRTLRRQRHGFRDAELADVLIPVMERLYTGTERVPRNRTKFSIRYALSVMASSQRTLAAITLLRLIHQRQPAFFSIHYFLRTMRTLVNAQRHHHALELLQMVQDFPARASENFRKKLSLRLAKKGASTLAERAYRAGELHDTREALARAVQFRVNAPAADLAQQVLSLFAGQVTHVPTLKYAMSLLVRAKRFYAARHVLERRHARLDAGTVTWLGNMILNGILLMKTPKHARLVRHVLHVRDHLVRRVGFQQDRVTVNIIVKMLLRWTTHISAPQIRSLFDHMVRSGYPAASRWRREGGVPFGTQSSSSGDAVTTLGLPAFVSFDRHVRPMYKMFIKALHMQGDRRGARTVIGILQTELDEVLVRRQARRRARLAGLLRKKELLRLREQRERLRLKGRVDRKKTRSKLK
ncbi:hypothetical protein B0H10DRAFT_2072240 [Mycena sp. CBHHK59/15]|nr:hypothetical protein B0H10DRAFT_2072240 [Mycena sp. CBHHK59/15]